MLLRKAVAVNSERLTKSVNTFCACGKKEFLSVSAAGECT
jgi:hypothetical protein